MELLGDLVGPERRSESLAYELAGERSRSYSYDALCTNAWKAANLLHHYGVRAGTPVGIADGPKDTDDSGPTPVAETLLALFGAAMLGAPVWFDPPPDSDVRALVGPGGWTGRYDLSPGSTYLAYGRQPDDPTVAHFERERWSENPIPMPAEFGPATTALVTGQEASGDAFDHGTLLGGAEAVVEKRGLTGESVVRIAAPLSDPGTVVAGVLAPLSAGGTITPDDEADLVVDGSVAAAARPLGRSDRQTY